MQAVTSTIRAATIAAVLSAMTAPATARGATIDNPPVFFCSTIGVSAPNSAWSVNPNGGGMVFSVGNGDYRPLGSKAVSWPTLTLAEGEQVQLYAQIIGASSGTVYDTGPWHYQDSTGLYVYGINGWQPIANVMTVELVSSAVVYEPTYSVTHVYSNGSATPTDLYAVDFTDGDIFCPKN